MTKTVLCIERCTIKKMTFSNAFVVATDISLIKQNLKNKARKKTLIVTKMETDIAGTLVLKLP